MASRVSSLRTAALQALFVSCSLMLVASPASAQWFASTYRPPVIMDELSPREIAQVAARHGFTHVSRPVYGDDFAVVSATDRNGRRARLTIDSFSGRVLRAVQLPGSPEPRSPDSRSREQVAQARTPAVAPAVRQAVPDTATQTRATPDKPTVVRREPMLPPQPLIQNPKAVTAPPLAPKPPQAAVQPRRIDMLPPPAELDAPPSAPRGPAPALAPMVPVAPLE